MIKNSIFVFLILIINGLTNATEANLILTIPQFFIVLFCVITRKINEAVFWHFIFFITSFTFYGDPQGNADGLQLISYNYAKFKFIGPISFSHIISLLLMVHVNFEYRSKLNKTELFYSFYRLLIFFMAIGFGIGLIGMAFSNYYFEGILIYGSYILIVFIHANILMKMSNTSLRKDLLGIIIPILALAPIVEFIFHQVYPEITDSTAISLFSMLLLPALLFQKKGIWINLIGLFFLIFNLIAYESSGKELIFLLIIAAITLLLSNSKSLKQDCPHRARLIRVVMLSFFIAIPTIVAIIFYYGEGYALIVSKIYQVETLFNFIFFGGGLETVAASPYVRVASLINILYEGLNNPLALLFGRGYGGYFQDHLNFFSHLDLARGGFSDKEISTGHFFTGHDTIVTVPMFNGLIGLYLLLKIVWKCIKFSKNNYLILSSVQFLLLVFYFDTLIGVVGVLLLFLGSLNLKN